MPSLDCKVYVGDLGSSANKHDLEDAFSQYGRLTSVWVARNPPGFAFVEFEDNRDAEDAVRALDGRWDNSTNVSHSIVNKQYLCSINIELIVCEFVHNASMCIRLQEYLWPPCASGAVNAWARGRRAQQVRWWGP